METGPEMDGEGAYWPSRKLAQAALRYIRLRAPLLMKGEGAEPEPWWMGKARAAGWTPPSEE